MKLGLGLKPHLWTEARLKLARQLGCESVVAWVPLPEGDGIWSVAQLAALRDMANRNGLDLAAIENFHPGHWDHIVLDEPGKERQMENICQTIANAGEVGIPCFGYSFSVCGVQGYYTERDNTEGRGLASIKRFDVKKLPVNWEPPLNQEFWFNTVLKRRPSEGRLPPVGEQEMWDRFHYFLKNALPVAESAGVKLCAHPDDPPVPTLRGMYRPLHSVEGHRKLLSLIDSPSNCLEFCQGTMSTMSGVDIYDVIREFVTSGKVGYVHFRNTSGTLPSYSEVFIDDGYVDMQKALEIYRECGFEGTLIPDHTPVVSSDEPWDTGMAYALGYMRAGINRANTVSSESFSSRLSH